MNTKAVEANMTAAMTMLSKIDEMQREMYGLMDSVRASLEEHRRMEEAAIKQIQERAAYEETEESLEDEAAQANEEIKPPTDAQIASMENQFEKNISSDELARMQK